MGVIVCPHVICQFAFVTTKVIFSFQMELSIIKSHSMLIYMFWKYSRGLSAFNFMKQVLHHLDPFQLCLSPKMFLDNVIFEQELWPSHQMVASKKFLPLLPNMTCHLWRVVSTRLDVGLLAFSSNDISLLGIDHKIRQCGIQNRNGHHLLQTRDKTNILNLHFGLQTPIGQIVPKVKLTHNGFLSIFTACSMNPQVCDYFDCLHPVSSMVIR